jgi:formylmethanofuran dehydrogenase subunit B
MANKSKAVVWENVPSPFCGIGTDDLSIEVDGTTLKVLQNGCSVNSAGFEEPLTDTAPRVGGETVTLEDAVAKAADILRETNLPLIGGLATDVNGMRAALALADRIGAVVDNMNSTAAMRNLLALQSGGWMNTTLAEVKNRADLLLVVGSDVESLYPRFFERYVWNQDAMFVDDTTKRDVVFLGRAPAGDAATAPDGRTAEVLACADADLPEVIAVLRALIHKKVIRANEVGGIPLASLQILAKKLKHARYSVVSWAAGSLDFAHAELMVQTLCELIKELNEHTRCSGLPLGGREGDQTANSVCGWITGYPVRTSFASGHPEYDPHLNAGDRLLADGEVDALLWVSAFNVERTPPVTDVPTITLGRSGMVFEKEPDVFIPLGTPGIDHNGHAYRMDNVVALRLRKLRDSGLPSSAEVLSAVEHAL